MPVTGDNSELPLPDLLGMVRFRTGALRFHGLRKVPPVELRVMPGFVRWASCGDRAVREETTVVDKLVAVATSVTGQFHFQALRPDEVEPLFQIPIDGLTLSVMTIVDEILYNQEQLPRRDQSYCFSPEAEGMDLQDTDPQLLRFLMRVKDLLEIGVSAEELASVLEIGVVQVQFYLLKLRALGVVEPLPWGDPFQDDPVLRLKSSALRLADEHQDLVEAVQRSEPLYRPRMITGKETWQSQTFSQDEPMPEGGRLKRLL